MKTKNTNFANLNNSKMAITRNFRNVLGGALVLALTLSSCEKEETKEDTKKPDGAALTERFENNRGDAVQTFIIDMEGGAVIVGDQGTQVTFPANSLGIAGSPITGNVDVELIEIYSKSDMLFLNMPTSGVKADGTHEILKSGGEFYLNATQDGNQLEILSGVSIKGRDTAPAEWENMNIFKAGDDKNDTDLWEEVDEDGVEGADAANAGEGEGGPAGGYVMYNYFDTSNFGWTNLDKWFNYPGELTDIFVDVPDGFNGDNCEVFLSYDGEANALARMDIYNSDTEMFTEHYGRIPVGQEIHIILVTEIDGDMYYTIQGNTVVEDHVEVMADPQVTTQSDLETLINALP